jgi:metal-responsive CopG/Arc/MetJ family transcriptional regulator
MTDNNMPNTKIHLAVISILVEDRQTNAGKMNQLLTDNGHLIMSRLGVNVQPACIESCTGLLAIVVKGTVAEIKDLTKKLDELYGLVAKVNIMTK